MESKQFNSEELGQIKTLQEKYNVLGRVSYDSYIVINI